PIAVHAGPSLTVRAMTSKSAPPPAPRRSFLEAQVSLDESEMPQHASATRSLPPRSGSIKQACSRYGIGRASPHPKAACTPRLFRKWGAKTLVDYEIMDKVFSELPPAEIKLPLSKARRG